jgi:ribonuclease T1
VPETAAAGGRRAGLRGRERRAGRARRRALPAPAQRAGPARRALRLAAALWALGSALPAGAREAPLAPDGAPGIRLADLPPEAREALARIEQGGPHPYRQDGATFGNRERILPARPRGYYREYTVRTPGSRDRGARRIVTGSGGERWYTDDHYRSFRRIEVPP